MTPDNLKEKALKKYPENWVEVQTKGGTRYLVDTNKLARAKYLSKLTTENVNK